MIDFAPDSDQTGFDEAEEVNIGILLASYWHCIGIALESASKRISSRSRLGESWKFKTLFFTYPRISQDPVSLLPREFPLSI